MRGFLVYQVHNQSVIKFQTSTKSFHHMPLLQSMFYFYLICYDINFTHQSYPYRKILLLSKRHPTIAAKVVIIVENYEMTNIQNSNL
jgi:hypothetical protein